MKIPKCPKCGGFVETAWAAGSKLLMATFLGSVLSFASLAVVHEYGPGECSREARTRTALEAELREARAINDVAHAALAAESARAARLSRDLASAATRMHYQTSRAEAITPDGHIATLAVTADGRPVDELQFVDADIAAAFSGCIYITGTPTQVQLARELKRFREDPDNPLPTEGHRR